ncbi:MAG TPA: hypothetical protein PLG41_05700 [Leptospiraceae bacterium]|nr:hypothetical protein [Leptospiraceae bacterium]
MNERDKTISTLFVPVHLIADLNEKVKSHGNSFSAYFRNLLSMYRSITHSNMLPDPKKIKTEYQEEGLRLVRVSFRPANVPPFAPSIRDQSLRMDRNWGTGYRFW